MRAALPYRTRAFGVTWASDIDLGHFAEDLSAGDDPDIVVKQVDVFADRECVANVNGGEVYADGFRLGDDPQAGFAMTGGQRIDYVRNSDWRGSMPARFYSTVAALTLAWRGTVPMHASAVAIDGRAILLCGATGAGKSTLTAALVAQGAGFVGDDLTVLNRHGDGAVVERGRTTMRLHPDTAGWVPAVASAPDARDARGKWLVEPQRDADIWQWPLSAVAVVGAGESGVDRTTLGAQVARQMFRPRWQATLPGHPQRVTALSTMISKVPMIALSSVMIGCESDFRALGEDAMRLLRDILAQRG